MFYYPNGKVKFYKQHSFIIQYFLLFYISKNFLDNIWFTH